MRYLLILLLLAATAAFAEEGKNETSIYTGGSQSSSALQIRGLDVAPDGVVRGTLVSQTSDVIRDVTLLINHTWQWKDEMHPGNDSPGRSVFFHVAGDVPALGTLDFTYLPSPPLPQRSDGHFNTSVLISRYTEVSFHKELRPVER